MNKQTTSVSHNDAAYDLSIGGWLQHLHSNVSKALLEIATEDILLPNRLLKYWFARMRPRTSTAQNGLQAIILSLARGGAPSKLSFF